MSPIVELDRSISSVHCIHNTTQRLERKEWVGLVRLLLVLQTFSFRELTKPFLSAIYLSIYLSVRLSHRSSLVRSSLLFSGLLCFSHLHSNLIFIHFIKLSNLWIKLKPPSYIDPIRSEVLNTSIQFNFVILKQTLINPQPLT